jgi:hypothetical protein
LRVGIAVLDKPRRQPDAVQAGRAGRDHRQVRPLEAEPNREVARDHVDDRRGDEERRNAPRSPGQVFVVRLFDQRQAADARADHAADALGLRFAELPAGWQSGISHRLQAGRQTIVDEHVHMPRVLGRHPVLDLEALDLAGKAASQWTGVELGDRGDARSSGQDVGPGRLDGVADRCDQTKSGDDDATTAHAGSDCLENEQRATVGASQGTGLRPFGA